MRSMNGLLVGAMAAMSLPMMAQEFDRRAEIRGGDPNRGRCEVVVVVDGAARIEIRRAEGRLIDERGAPAIWRHFECSAEMPADPRQFGFRKASGRGRAVLIQPARGGGPAVIRIEDPQGGAGEYRLELFWQGGAGYQTDRRGERNGGAVGGNDRREERNGGLGGAYDLPRGWSSDDAISNCRTAVQQQARERFRAERVDFRRIEMDNAPDRREWVVGVIEVQRDRDNVAPFRFSCSADFGGRRVRSVDISPMVRERERR
jgi:hypothetical protein